MKSLTSTLTLLMLLIFSYSSFSNPIEEKTAKSVAITFAAQGSIKLTSPSLLSLLYAKENAFYVFGNASSFIIVAADDRVTPILGYSNEGPFIVPTDANDTVMGNNFWGLMNSFDQQISYVVDNNIPATDAITAQWNALQNGQTTKSASAVVAPLLTTTWNQGWPYNSMCPVDASGPGGHVWAGCVATALAQILKYHNYPSQGLGSYGYQWGSYPTTAANFGTTTYNWTNMPNSISTVNNDVATLIYQTAVSCRSMWGAGSTGVGYLNTEDPMTRALPNYFKFAFAGLQYVDKANYTATQWDNLLQNELINNRPVYYRGDGSLGHAFVCDGVDASNLYHFNWGWGGSYNGYYSLSTLNPGGNNLSNNQAAIIGIKPNDGSTLVVNTTWSSAMTLSTNIAVPDAITLTVNAGATIKFAQNCKLQVWGKVLSTGTSSSYAKFTAVDTTAGWSGIKFDNNYMNYEVMSDNDSSKFIYSQIEYSKMRGVTIKNFHKVVFDHCKINNNYIAGDEYGYYAGHGAGIFSNYSTVTIKNSEIYKNHATVYGGGFLVASNDTFFAIISGNDIYQNISDGRGGGFYLSHTAIFSNNLVHHNQAGSGAGAALMGWPGLGEMSIVNNKFCNNSTIGSSGNAGGLYLESCSANIVNNLIANNFAGTATTGSSGGINCTQNSSPQLIGNTIVNNSSRIGAGINFSGNSDAHLKDCIIYGNYSTNFGSQVSLGDIDSDPFFDHCDIQAGVTGFGGPGSGTNYTTGNYTNNVDASPLFVSPSAGIGSGYDGLLANWQLQSSSPCINTGDTTGISTLLPVLDLAGNPRLNGIIDLGAYEYGCTPVPVSVSIVANNNPICAGTSVTFTATPTNGGTTPSYQWKVNGVNAGTNSSSYTYVPLNGDIVTCVLTSNLTCTTNNPATSNAITLAVTTPLAVSVSIVANNNPICAGTSVTFTATPTNGGTTPSYQWKVNGVNAGTNSSSYTYVPLNGDIVTCVLTSNLTCTTNNPATSNAITLAVTTPLAVSVSIVANNNPICAGTSVTFTATPTNGGTTPSYHWKVNGVNAGTNSSSYTYVPLNGDIVTCVLTSNLTCTTNNPATSNAIAMTVTTPLAVSVSIVANNNPICAGASVTFTATPVNGGTTPSYQWKVNGVNAGTNNSSYTYVPLNGDIVTCVLTSSLTCTTNNPATSNAITMTVTTPLAVSVSIVANTNPICAGTSVTFTATPTNGGTIPSYQWKVNGVNAGTNNSSYTYVPLNGDIVTCVLTSSLTCTTNNPATSNAIAMTVNALPLANAGTDQSINYGLSTTLNGSASNGSGSYTWHWEPATLVLNANIQNPTTLNLTSSAQFTLTVTDAVSGCIGSDQVLILVTGGPLSVSATANPGTVCEGSGSQLTAITSGGSGTYTFSWSSIPAGFTSDLQNPLVYPSVNTSYMVAVNDGFNTATSNVAQVLVQPLPELPVQPVGPDRVDLVYIATSEYSVLHPVNTISCIWELVPVNAGSITGMDTTATVIWNPTYLGNAEIKVRSVNSCGESAWSAVKVTEVDNTVGMATLPDCEILVFPNPTQDRFTVSLYGEAWAEPIKISLFKMDGKIIAENCITVNSERKKEFSLAELPAGVYILRVGGMQKTTIRKVVKL